MRNNNLGDALGKIQAALFCTLLAASIPSLTGCTKNPNELELKPANHTFIGIEQNVWFEAVPRMRGGQRFPKLAADVRWTSADESIVKVDSHGRATSVGPGTTFLKASYGSMQYEIPVEVRVVGKIELNVDSVSLAVTGDEDEIIRTPVQITGAVFDTLGRKIEGLKPILSCKDENVCRTSNDSVIPVDAGETVLTARLERAESRIPVKVVSQVKKGRSTRRSGKVISF